MDNLVKFPANDSKDIIADTVNKLRNMIDFEINEADEQKLKEKLEAKIQAKLEAGKRLSQKELNYLKRYNPMLYAHAIRVEIKRRTVEERLKHADSKQEVQEIYDEAIASIGKDDPAKKYMIAAVQETIKEFKKTEDYKKLPEYDDKRNNNKTNKLRNDDKSDDDNEIIYEFSVGSYQIAYQDEKVGGKGFAAFS